LHAAPVLVPVRGVRLRTWVTDFASARRVSSSRASPHPADDMFSGTIAATVSQFFPPQATVRMPARAARPLAAVQPADDVAHL
jgi:hypothetical protein